MILAVEMFYIEAKVITNPCARFSKTNPESRLDGGFAEAAAAPKERKIIIYKLVVERPARR